MAILSSDKLDVVVSNNFKTTGFKIQASAKAFEILSSNIYTHKVRAVVREISCNAHDAHVAAGNPDPFDVHLPTSLEPWFSVRDYGTGLCDEDVRNIFTTYFCSTKTNSNDYIGALGLGSKSPFCLVDSFVVKSFYNGTATTYSCYKDEHGEPQISSLTSESTDEPNGLYICVNVDGKFYEFENEAVEVYQYFKQIPNINNKLIIERIESAKNRYNFVADDGSMALSSEWGTLKAVMGNVAYDIDSKFDSISCEGYIRFEIGELSFNAGREELSYDNTTKERIEKRLKEVKENFKQMIKDKIEQEDHPFYRARMAHELNRGAIHNMVGSELFTNYYLPILDGDNEKIPLVKYYTSKGLGYRGVDFTESKYLPVSKNTKYFRYVPRMDKRIRSWCKHSRNVNIVLLNDEQIKFFNLPEDLIEDAQSFFPKVESSYVKNSTNRTNACVYNISTYHNEELCWKDCTISVQSGKRIYVRINRYKPDPVEGANSLYYKSNRAIYNIINFIKKYSNEEITVYGLKNSYIESAAFKKGDWIELEAYLHEVAESLPALYDVDVGDMSDLSDIVQRLSGMTNDENINTFCEMCNDKNEADLNAYAKMKLYHKIIKNDSGKELLTKIVADYPVIKLLNRWMNESEYKIVADYIGEKLNAKQN